MTGIFHDFLIRRFLVIIFATFARHVPSELLQRETARYQGSMLWPEILARKDFCMFEIQILECAKGVQTVFLFTIPNMYSNLTVLVLNLFKLFICVHLKAL